MKDLAAGSAEFIGSTPAMRLLERGDEAVGSGNHNGYYDPVLKEARLGSRNFAWSGANPDPASSAAPRWVNNIGNNKPVELLDYIGVIEFALGCKANKELLPLPPGDVPDTYANVDHLVEKFQYRPSTSVEQGIAHFVAWYRHYYKV